MKQQPIVIFVRHAQSCQNVRRGREVASDSPLSDTGVEQAYTNKRSVRCIYNFVRKHGGSIDGIFSSTSQRAKETAVGIGEQLLDHYPEILSEKSIFETVENAREISSNEMSSSSSSDNSSSSLMRAVNNALKKLRDSEKNRPSILVLVTHGNLMKRDLKLKRTPQNTEAFAVGIKLRNGRVVSLTKVQDRCGGFDIDISTSKTDRCHFDP